MIVHKKVPVSRTYPYSDLIYKYNVFLTSNSGCKNSVRQIYRKH